MDDRHFDHVAKIIGTGVSPKHSRRRALASLAAAVVAATAGAQRPRVAEANHCDPGYTHVTVLGSQLWTDTGVTAQIGDAIGLRNVSGRIKIAGSDPGKSAFGEACNAGDEFPIPGNRCWQIMGHVGGGWNCNIGFGDGGWGFFATHSGRIHLGINDTVFGDNSGQWTACLRVEPQYCSTVGLKYCHEAVSASSGHCIEKSQPCLSPADPAPPAPPPSAGGQCSGNATPCGRYGLCLNGYCRTAKEDCMQDAMAAAASGQAFEDIMNLLKNKKGKKRKKKNRCGAAAKETFFEIAAQLCYQQTFPMHPDICRGWGFRWGP